VSGESGGWVVDERRGSAAELHQCWPAADAFPNRRTVGLCRVTDPAIVLGSSQPEAVVDAARTAEAGVTVARRRSGGGAVMVTPDDPVWIDAWIPVDDPLWCADVGRAFDWLGETWVRALGRAGVTGARAHRGAPVSCTRWSSLICFGGVGAGEVVAPDGRKLVGLAQRRNRFGAWFHGACIVRWDPRPLVDLLVLSPHERHAAQLDLDAAVVGAGDLAGPMAENGDRAEAITAALLASLP
jgi:lipoate---protein ligase